MPTACRASSMSTRSFGWPMPTAFRRRTFGPSATDVDATVTIPAGGSGADETMPHDSCVYFYECVGCGVILRPKEGDCCVFCSYADRDCPPKNGAGDCCGG